MRKEALALLLLGGNPSKALSYCPNHFRQLQSVLVKARHSLRYNRQGNAVLYRNNAGIHIFTVSVGYFPLGI